MNNEEEEIRLPKFGVNQLVSIVPEMQTEYHNSKACFIVRHLRSNHDYHFTYSLVTTKVDKNSGASVADYIYDVKEKDLEIYVPEPPPAKFKVSDLVVGVDSSITNYVAPETTFVIAYAVRRGDTWIYDLRLPGVVKPLFVSIAEKHLALAPNNMKTQIEFIPGDLAKFTKKHAVKEGILIDTIVTIVGKIPESGNYIVKYKDPELGECFTHAKPKQLIIVPPIRKE